MNVKIIKNLKKSKNKESTEVLNYDDTNTNDTDTDDTNDTDTDDTNDTNDTDTDDTEKCDDENYIIKTSICKRLSRELNELNIKYDNICECSKTEYTPPTEHGLKNCNDIIPKYYQLHKHPSRILNFNYFEMIKDDIRNCRILNEYQLNYIKELSHECKNELFDIYNICTKLYNDILS